MNKRVLVVLILSLMMFVVSIGCGKSTDNTNGGKAEQVTPAVETEEVEKPEIAPSSDPTDTTEEVTPGVSTDGESSDKEAVNEEPEVDETIIDDSDLDVVEEDFEVELSEGEEGGLN